MPARRRSKSSTYAAARASTASRLGAAGRGLAARVNATNAEAQPARPFMGDKRSCSRRRPGSSYNRPAVREETRCSVTARYTRLLMPVALVVLWLGSLVAVDKSPAAMAASATKFLDALSPELRQRAAFAFDVEGRLNWHYIPRERKGLPIKAMSEDQRKLARELLRNGLSQRGYMTATSIMDLETILGDLERGGRGTIVRDPELYFFSVFGTPSSRGAWGWRVEGHHLSLNFTVVNGALVASSPQFFWTNPAEVRQ